MKSQYVFANLAVLVWVSLVSTSAVEAQSCQVKITSLQPDSRVGAVEDVRGTAKIPPDTFIWVLARRDDLPKRFYWPQGSVAAKDMKDGKWSVTVNFGQSQDVGRKFKVTVVVVNGDTDHDLNRWLEEAPSKNYVPRDFPTPVQGCPIDDVIITKHGH